MAAVARWLGSIGVGLALAACTGPPERAVDATARTAIEGVTLIDVDGGTDGGVVVRRREHHRVVFEGDRIVHVGPMAQAAPLADSVIEGAGRYLIPGLWDAHVHFVYDEALTEAMPGLFLRWGITSVRDTGGELARLTALRAKWRADGVGPRIFVAGPLLDGRHVVYDGENPSQPPLGTSVPDAEAAAARVAALRAGGADLIKIYELVSPEVFDALVRAARAQGLPIASHVPLSMTADRAGPRVDSMEHLRNVELGCARDWERLHAERLAALREWSGDRGYPLRRSLHQAQRLAAIADYDAARCETVLASLRGTMQVPTLRLNAFNLSRPDLDPAWRAASRALPADVIARWDAKVEANADDEARADFRFGEWSLFLVGRMREAGVPLAAGTDTPINLAIPGESLHRELELLVRSGLSPAEALAAATRAPARFFGLEGELGRIEPGFRADVVLLESDPLVDIRHTRTIRGVVRRGRWRDAGD